MLNWQMFQEKIFIHKPDLNSELLAIDHQNQIGIYYQKNETDLFFGFIESTSDENLKSLIVQIEKFAKINNFKKVIGPIDGATWNNYRFQFKIAVPNAYYGQPTYSKKICDVFLQSGFVVSEMYETIEIKNYFLANGIFFPRKIIRFRPIKQLSEYSDSYKFQRQYRGNRNSDAIRKRKRSSVFARLRNCWRNCSNG